MEFTNSTLTNILKKAKKIHKANPDIKLTPAKDIVAKELGFKSYSDCCKQFYEWLNMDNIIVVFSKNDLGEYFYKISENDLGRSIERPLTVKDLNHTQNFGLKLIDTENGDIEAFISKYTSLKHIIERFTNNYDDYVFFEFTSNRVSYSAMFEEYIQSPSLQRYFDGHKKTSGYTDEDVLRIQKSWFYGDFPYKIDNFLKQKKPLNPSYHYESCFFNPKYYLLKDKFIDVIALYNQEFSEYI